MRHMRKRDEFTKKIAETLAKRAGMVCSSPHCKQPTAGPQADPAKSANIGVAAHITAASEGGPRYDKTLNSETRSAIKNGIWLCQNCAKLVDNDQKQYTTELLRNWKEVAEQAADAALKGSKQPSTEISAKINFNWKLIQMDRPVQPTRHEYRLDVGITNTGTNILNDYYLELEMPTELLTSRGGTIAGRSDNNVSLFRWTCHQGKNDDIYPKDSKNTLGVEYFVDENIYSDKQNLFDFPVRASLYKDGKLVVSHKQRFREIQNF